MNKQTYRGQNKHETVITTSKDNVLLAPNSRFEAFCCTIWYNPPTISGTKWVTSLEKTNKQTDEHTALGHLWLNYQGLFPRNLADLKPPALWDYYTSWIFIRQPQNIIDQFQLMRSPIILSTSPKCAPCPRRENRETIAPLLSHMISTPQHHSSL